MNDKICGHYLDSQQQEIVLDKSKYLLVIAGAGSGKTMTILGKINYLVKYKNVPKDDILCISFTKEASNSLKQKILKEFSLDITVYTFHKLSLEILKDKSYQIASSDLLDNIINNFFYIDIYKNDICLKNTIKYLGYIPVGNLASIYDKILSTNKVQIESLEKTLSTFIHLFKCNNFDISSFPKFIKDAKRHFKVRNSIFLYLAFNIYLIYQNYLKENHEIDFDDMLIYAKECINKEGKYKNFKYIIVDEYQDTSFIRFALIKEIIEKNEANLLVVGDDYQSIYRFTGCDISLFLDFQKYFPSAKIMKIETTYRNSQELITVAGKFVMQNKRQIVKELKSNKKLDKPVKIIYYQNNINTPFIRLVIKIKSQGYKELLVLGRNNKDINKLNNSQDIKLNDNKIIIKNHEDMQITYLTAHKSKGLESENVIIINMDDDILGFPSKIEDEKLLNYVTKEKETYPYAEERRLFYVALTRTKNYVYLLVDKTKPSPFIKEIVKYKKYVEVLKKP